MAEVKLIVLYPTDIEQFNQDYHEHVKLLHKRMQTPEHMQPYTLTRFVEMPQGKPIYTQMFTLPFPSAKDVQQALGTQEMKEVAADDAARLSSGGAPVILAGVEGE
jgi:uncharacterized protein (TIGR02118 family)